MTDEIRASAIAQQPTGRLGTPNDTANLVRFLLSKQASGLTDNSCTATAATRKAGSPSDHRHTAHSPTLLRTRTYGREMAAWLAALAARAHPLTLEA